MSGHHKLVQDHNVINDLEPTDSSARISGP